LFYARHLHDILNFSERTILFPESYNILCSSFTNSRKRIQFIGSGCINIDTGGFTCSTACSTIPLSAAYYFSTVTAAAVTMEFKGLKTVEKAVLRFREKALFPYVPGLFSFREMPAALKVIEKLNKSVDLFICDGQGIAHPRRFGIASHVGLLAGLPSIGCAKSLLTGHHGPVPNERGAYVPLTYRGEQIGAVLRTRVGVKPVYISVGHRISLSSAIHYVMSCTIKYRLPEPTRAADGLASHGKIPIIASPPD
jgi:deoxyribonuclease V